MPANKNLHAGHRSRMRERYKDSDGVGFGDHELLEMLLYYALPRVNTNEMAHSLLDSFGCLSGLFKASVSDLTNVEGIGESAAILLKIVFDMHKRMLIESDSKAEFTSFSQIGDYFVKLFAHEDTEKVIMLLFDKRGRIVKQVTMADGDLEKARINLAAMLGHALYSPVDRVAIGHNHPSGVLAPSINDKTATMVFEQSLNSFNVGFVDHYVIADGRYIGIKENCYGVRGRAISEADL